MKIYTIWACLASVTLSGTSRTPRVETGVVIEKLGDSTQIMAGVLKLQIDFRAPKWMPELITRSSNFLLQTEKILDYYVTTDLEVGRKMRPIASLVETAQAEVRTINKRIGVVEKFDWIMAGNGSIRDKRGLVNIAGVLLKDLFGLSTENDVKLVDDKVNIIHEAFLLTNQALLQLNQDHVTLKKELNNLKTKQLRQEHKNEVFYHVVSLRAQLCHLSIFITFLESANHDLTRFRLEAMKDNRAVLPTSLFSYEIFRSINDQAQEDLLLKSWVVLQKDTFTEYLSSIRVFPTPFRHVLLLLVPFTTGLEYDLFKFRSFPTAHPSLPHLRLQMPVHHPFILLSRDLQSTTRLTLAEFGMCLHLTHPRSSYLCAAPHPLYAFHAHKFDMDQESLCMNDLLRSNLSHRCLYEPYVGNATITLRSSQLILISSLETQDAILDCFGNSSMLQMKPLTYLHPGCRLTSKGFSVSNQLETTRNITFLSLLPKGDWSTLFHSQDYPIGTLDSPAPNFTLHGKIIMDEIKLSQSRLLTLSRSHWPFTLSLGSTSLIVLLILSFLVYKRYGLPKCFCARVPPPAAVSEEILREPFYISSPLSRPPLMESVSYHGSDTVSIRRPLPRHIQPSPANFYDLPRLGLHRFRSGVRVDPNP